MKIQVQRETLITAPSKKVTLKSLTLYEVVSNTDLTEGRGAPVCLGWFDDMHLADEFAKGKGVFGSPAKVHRVIKDFIFGDEENICWGLDMKSEKKIEIIHEDPEALRRRALAKLSPQDRKILGLE